jgi:hypothetical protein
MASKQLYPCFACRKAGHEVQVFLDGKDEQGRTKYLNEDGTTHTHLGSSNSTSQPSVTVCREKERDDPVMKMLNDLNIKMNQVIRMLEDQR